MLILSVTLCLADGSDDPTPIKNDGGKYYDKDGNPTFKIAADGTVDWYTYSGYRRYNAECEVCHGPDGEGSTFAPSLIDSLKTMNYSEFVNVIVNGRKNVDAANDKVMPSFGTNPNVMCYLDDIFVYLRARSERKLGRGRPSKHEDKPDSAKKSENACVGSNSPSTSSNKRVEPPVIARPRCRHDDVRRGYTDFATKSARSSHSPR